MVGLLELEPPDLDSELGGDGHHRGDGAAHCFADRIGGGEGGWVELSERRAKLVELALPGPDQTLMGPGQDFDRLGQVTVTGDGSMVVAIETGQLCEDPGVAGIGLRPGAREPLPIPRRRQRVDRQHRVARRDHRPDEQAAIGLRRDHHLGRVLDVTGHRSMEPGHTLDPLGQPTSSEASAIAVLHEHVMVSLGPEGGPYRLEQAAYSTE
jgi:hypothetical protein